MMKFLEEEQVAAAKGDCGCDDVTKEVIEKYFRVWSPEFLLNMADGRDGVHWESKSCDLSSPGGGSEQLKVNMPKTCTKQTWAEKGTCHAQVQLDNMKVALVLRVEKCAASSMPFVQLKCEGEDCPYVFSVCSETADCNSATMECAQIVDYSDQCALETCTAQSFNPFGGDPLQPSPIFVDGSNTKLSRASPGDCSKPDAGQARAPATGCDLNGVKYGVGFTYFKHETPGAADPPAHMQDIKDCKRITCGADNMWQTGDGNPQQCWEALVYQIEATGEYCEGHGEFRKNALWPLSRENTCNWDEIHAGGDLAHFHGVDVSKIKPFYTGATRYVSNARDSVASMIGYDAIDFIANPFGCMSGEKMMDDMKQFMRGVFDRAAKKMEKTLKNTNQLGLCLPGAGYNLMVKAAPEHCSQVPAEQLVHLPECQSPWTEYEVSISGDPGQFIKDQLKIDCAVKCDQVTRDGCTPMPEFGEDCLADRCTFDCPNDDLAATKTALSAADKKDGSSARKVRTVEAVTPSATVVGHLSCDGSAAFHPNHAVLGIEWSARGMLEMAHWFRGEHRQAYDCRAQVHGGSKLDEKQYNVRSFTLDNILYFVTSPVATSLTNIGAPFADMRVAGIANEGRLKMPATCTYDSWIESGQCRVKFTGFSDPRFFDAQFDLNIYASVCPGSFMPELYAECVGSGCKFLDGPKPCKNDASCAGTAKGLVCEALGDVFDAESSRREYYNAHNLYQQTTLNTVSGPGQVATVDVNFEGQADRDPMQRAPDVVPIKFEGTPSLDGSTLRVSFSNYANGAPADKVQVAEGAYSGKFAEVEGSGGYNGCSSDELDVTPTYESGKVFVTAKCNCKTRTKRAAAPASAPATPSRFQRLLDAVRGFVAPHTAPRKRNVRQEEPPVAPEDTVTVQESTPSVSFFGVLVGMYPSNKPTCTKEAQDKRTESLVSRLLHQLSDTPYTGDNSFCFVDTRTKGSNGVLELQQWAEDQVSIDGDSITLVNLKPWETADNKPVKPVDGGKTIMTAPWRLDEGVYSKTRFGENGVFDPSETAAGVASLALALPLLAALAALQ